MHSMRVYSHNKARCICNNSGLYGGQLKNFEPIDMGIQQPKILLQEVEKYGCI